MSAYDWDAAWTTGGIAVDGDTVTDTNSATSDAISNDGKLATEVAVEIGYGGIVDEGAMVYVLRDVDDNYEAVTDDPWGFEMPSTISVTRRKTFTVPGTISDFKVHVVNDTGASITVDIDYRQAVV